MIRPLLRAGALAACALALSGCVSLLPKSKPSTLYNLSGAIPAAERADENAVGVFQSAGTFQREAAGDRILTITGEKAAFIAQARWVAPAASLFDQAVLAAFDSSSPRVRLVSRGEMAKSNYILRLDVRNFETHYDQGPDAAPKVVIRVRASMTRGLDRTLVSDEMFEATVRAGDNRVSAIVRAYDAGLSEVMGKLVAWTNERAAA